MKTRGQDIAWDAIHEGMTEEEIAAAIDLAIAECRADAKAPCTQQPVGKSITDHPQWPLVAKEQWEAEQVLGKALGYPWYKDDKKNFPDAADADGVCTGEHTFVTIAMEAASRLKQESPWQPIATAPHGEWILVADMYGVGSWQACRCDDGYWRTLDGTKLIDPQHWMPLPQPTKKVRGSVA